MRLNEDYFKDIEITDDDIESSDDIVISNNNEYDNPEQMFIDMKSKYAHCIEIPLKRDIQWKLNPNLIIKRLLYMFNAYGIEYSEPTLQEHIYIKQNLENGYSKCNFINYNGFKFISNYYKTPEMVDRTKNTISLVVFFNLPEIRSYKSVCVFISNIFSCIQNNSIKHMTSGYFIIRYFDPVPQKRSFSANYMNYKRTIASYIESAITMFFPEKSETIREELHTDDNALLNKLLKYIKPYKFS